MFSRGHRGSVGRVLAYAATVVLLAGSVGLAQPAFAERSDTGEAHAAKGRAHQPEQPGRTTRHRGGHAAVAAASHSGSAVSLPRPNDFQAQADPDGTENGGVDQPGGTGGVDPTDQDGNNGSGNDSDCEDDNLGVGVPGHCDGAVVPEPPTGDEELPGDSGTTTSVAVAPPVVEVMTPVASSTSLTRGSDGATAVLPDTGAGQSLLALAVAAVGALAFGAGLVRRGRRARVTA